MESKCKHYNKEAKHQQRNIDVTDSLPTVEPYLTVDTNCLHSTPETVREVEPQCSNPNNVEHYINRISECVLDVSKTIRWFIHKFGMNKLCKHHVVPEVEEVKSKTEQHDNTKNKHVLACPLYRCRLLCNSITVVTTCTAVLRCKNKRINDVTNCQ